MNLSPHFTLREFVFSQTATRHGIDNTPSKEAIINMKTLCGNVLEPLREMVGKPIRITSGYRSETLNRLVKGSKTSQHRFGKAADIQMEGMSTEELFLFIRNRGLADFLLYDQLIQEFAESPGGGWVHISYNWRMNRKQNLIAKKEDGRTVYYEA